MSEQECPTCGRDNFKSRKGMRRHHNDAHGESLVGETKECENCGNKFEYRPSKSEKVRKYCGKDCFYEAHSENLSNKVTITCENCGVEKDIKTSDVRENGNFCSHECFNDWNTGENNHFFGKEGYWKGGERVKNYGASWNQKREEAIKRDFEQCRICGMTREKHYEEFGCDLSVHHQTPVTWFDNKEKAHRLRNLITLCKSCHRKTEEEWYGGVKNGTRGTA